MSTFSEILNTIPTDGVCVKIPTKPELRKLRKMVNSGNRKAWKKVCEYQLLGEPAKTPDEVVRKKILRDIFTDGCWESARHIR